MTVHFLGVPDDLVDDLGERSARVDHDSTLGKAFCRPIQPRGEVSFGLLSAELVFRPLLQPTKQGVQIDIEYEHTVEEVNDFREVPRTTTEEGHRLLVISGQGPHQIEIPDPALVQPSQAGQAVTAGCVSATVHGYAGFRVGFAGFRIALTGQHAVAVDGLVAASKQFLAHRGLTAAGPAFDQKIPHAHRRIVLTENLSARLISAERGVDDVVIPVDDHDPDEVAELIFDGTSES